MATVTLLVCALVFLQVVFVVTAQETATEVVLNVTTVLTPKEQDTSTNVTPTRATHEPGHSSTHPPVVHNDLTNLNASNPAATAANNSETPHHATAKKDSVKNSPDIKQMKEPGEKDNKNAALSKCSFSVVAMIFFIGATLFT